MERNGSRYQEGLENCLSRRRVLVRQNSKNFGTQWPTAIVVWWNTTRARWPSTRC